MLRIRLTRTGRKNRPSYRVVVAEAGWAHDGRRVAELGYYDPMTEPSTVRLDVAAAEDWIRKGAQPSERVQKLLAIARSSAPSVLEGAAPRGESSSLEADAGTASAEVKPKVVAKAKTKTKTKTKAKTKAKTRTKAKAAAKPKA